ncbi:hypothetical protein [Reichenbachiella versicolor]|uniref:hypothetical protein n=1 Tax=Reichenbachiella versicolor TaxID=1821036 RepID=UPI000D6E6066|nr:hypothetical protein [Reichenbachiella versicolor]
MKRGLIIVLSVYSIFLLNSCETTEGLPVVQFSERTSYAFESYSPTAVDLLIEGDFDSPVSISYELSGSVDLETDIAMVTDSTFTITPSDSVFNIAIRVLPDGVEEDEPEDVVLTLTAIKGGVFGQYTDHTIQIQSDISQPKPPNPITNASVVFGDSTQVTYRFKGRAPEPFLVTYNFVSQKDASGRPMFTTEESITVDQFRTSFSVPVYFNENYTGDYIGDAATITIKDVVGQDSKLSYLDYILDLTSSQVVNVTPGKIFFELDWIMNSTKSGVNASEDVNIDICVLAADTCTVSSSGTSTRFGETFSIDSEFVDGNYVISAVVESGTFTDQLAELTYVFNPEGLYTVNGKNAEEYDEDEDGAFNLVVSDLELEIGDTVKYTLNKSKNAFTVAFKEVASGNK